MTCWTLRPDLYQDRIAITVDPKLSNPQEITRSGPFAPKLLPATTPEMHLARLQSQVQGLPVHPSQHEQLKALNVLNHGRQQTIVIPV